MGGACGAPCQGSPALAGPLRLTPPGLCHVSSRHLGPTFGRELLSPGVASPQRGIPMCGSTPSWWKGLWEMTSAIPVLPTMCQELGKSLTILSTGCQKGTCGGGREQYRWGNGGQGHTNRMWHTTRAPRLRPRGLRSHSLRCHPNGTVGPSLTQIHLLIPLQTKERRGHTGADCFLKVCVWFVPGLTDSHPCPHPMPPVGATCSSK